MRVVPGAPSDGACYGGGGEHAQVSFLPARRRESEIGRRVRIDKARHGRK